MNAGLQQPQIEEEFLALHSISTYDGEEDGLVLGSRLGAADGEVPGAALGSVHGDELGMELDRKWLSEVTTKKGR